MADSIALWDTCINATYVSFDGDTSLQIKPKNHFVIMHNTDSRTPDIDSTIGYDPYTQYRLPYCPEGYTSSIRIGNLGGGTESDALYYTMRVTSENSLLTFKYACVIEDPGAGGHGPADDPVFIIRVMKEDYRNPGTWYQISDTLCYMQPSTACNNSQAIPGQCIDTADHSTGWHNNPLPSSSGYGSYYRTYWKDWTPVAVSLAQFIGENVRVEIIVGDCAYSQHFGYAYIVGESQPMVMVGQGCPVGESTSVDTLNAPHGLDRYAFYKKISGPDDVQGLDQKFYSMTPDSSIIRTRNPNGDIYQWERIDRPSVYGQPNRFALEQEDFYNAAENKYDGIKYFMCRMTSYMDPIKPIYSYVFTDIQYNKPVVMIDSMPSSDKSIKLINKSESPNKGSNPEATYWLVYDNPLCVGQPQDTINGDTVDITFEHGGMNGLLLYVQNITEPGVPMCYSTRRLPMKVLESPQTTIEIADRNPCQGSAAVLNDATYRLDYSDTTTYRRIWRFEGIDTLTYNRYLYVEDSAGNIDTVLNSSADKYKRVSQVFEQSIVPVELDVYNGDFYVLEGDTTWCHTVAYDTIHVFVNPKLNVTGDRVVCKGQRTDMHVEVEVEDPSNTDTYSYQWSTTRGSIGGGLPPGPDLAVEPTRDTTVYYVLVTNNSSHCQAWSQDTAFLVSPRISIIPADGLICPGDTAILYGSAAHSYSWSASPIDISLDGQQEKDTIRIVPTQTTRYTMVGHGSNGCNATALNKTVTIVPKPALAVQTNPGIIDSEDPTVVFRDVSDGRAYTVWDMGDGSDPIGGQEVTYTFDETYVDTVFVRMTSSNNLGQRDHCSADTVLAMPVVQFTAWTPNIFTPSLETNNRFRLYTINAYEYFTIYIYDRRGRLIYEANDANFEWDGRDINGREVPQGAYAWIMRYRRPGTPDIVTRKGSITVVR